MTRKYGQKTTRTKRSPKLKKLLAAKGVRLVHGYETVRRKSRKK
jgi:hypothetical protein